MKRACAILALFCFLPAGLWADEKPAEPLKGSLKAYVIKTQGRQAYGVYIQDKKIGWMVTESKLTKLDGKEVAITAEELFVEIKRGGDGLKLEVTSSTYFGLEGDGPILLVQESSKENGKEKIQKGTRKGDAFTISTTSNGRTIDRSVAPPKKDLASSRKLDAWLEGTPAKGAEFESFGLSLEDKEIDTKEVYTFLSKEKVSWGGVPTDVFHVSLLSKGIKTAADITADGTIIKGKLGGFLELRAEPEATAKKLDTKSIDLMSLSSIKVDKDLGDPRRVESLTLEVSGLDDFKMPDAPRQKVRTEKGTTVVELRREFRTDKAEPLSKKEKTEYLEATPTIQSDNEKVRALARKIVREEKDPNKVTRLLVRWVSSSLRPTYKANASTTLDVLDNMAGDCTEHTLLFVSLARACGVPAREVGGVMFAELGQPFFAWHAWAEVHDGKQWIAVDPTWNEMYVDATHVKFSEGDDMGWLNVLGRVKFKAVKFESKPDTQEALTKEIIETTDDLIELVASIKDEASARDARLRLRRLNERLRDLKQRSEVLGAEKKKGEKTETEKKSPKE
jgi:hypothetical protein